MQKRRKRRGRSLVRGVRTMRFSWLLPRNGQEVFGSFELFKFEFQVGTCGEEEKFVKT